MRRLFLAATAAALAAAMLTPAPAGAFQTTIGGLAGQCSRDAKQGRHDPAAIKRCTDALALDILTERDRAGTLVNRGAMKLLNKDWEAAVADFDAALRLKPDMGEALIGRGVYLISQERFAEAEADIDLGLKAGSEELEKGYYFRGLARWGQDDFRGAYLDFRKALELRPGWRLPEEHLSQFTVTRAGSQGAG